MSKQAARNNSRSGRTRQQDKPIVNNENVINLPKPQKPLRRNVNLIPKSLGQENLIVALTNTRNDVVVAVGPAGTGKTYLAMQAAIRALQTGETDRIVLTRPAVGVDDEEHGFLPGDLNQKMEPWTRPLIDVFKEYYSVAEVEYMIAEGTIEISPLAYMRGRTFKNAWVILDESQNTSPKQMLMFLTRIGENSKLVVTGDIEQTDHKKGSNGLLDLCSRLKAAKIKSIATCELTQKDVQRHPLIKDIIDMYNEL